MSNTSDPTTRASDLLAEWEQAHHPLPPAPRQAFLQLVAELLDHPDSGLDREDVRYTLSRADRLGFARAEATGPDRATSLLTEVLTQLPDEPTPTGRLLVSFSSDTDDAFEMDELSLILEGLQQRVGPEWEMVFGHCDAPSQQSEVRLLVLQAFDASSQTHAV